MKTVTDFPHRVVEEPDAGIMMSDGCRLSARIWMPADALSHPVPAILEHLPYRKRDGTIARDETMHPWFAGHGYACVRTDMRGNGDSQGLMEDEYTDQEWQDACEVIAWMAAQPWCSGRVGMMGISWGGFNGLQVAALRPPALKAVITLCSTVDRFADDIHYKGGCLLTENIGWAAQMLSYSARPPDPMLVGEQWRDTWLQRLDSLPDLASTWHRHQCRDAYWQRGSVCEDYSAIDVPVLAVGGWHDGYRNTVSHLVANLHSPVKGIVGPWIHKYPHYAAPQPAIGFLQEARRWWDHWLRQEDRGVMEDPDYRVWLMDSIAPERWLPERPGRWIAEMHWPSAFIEEQVLQLICVGQAESDDRIEQSTSDDSIEQSANLQPGILRDAAKLSFPGEVEPVTISSPFDCGETSGEYFPFALGPELPDEQSADDARSAVFDGEVLETGLELVGAPVLHLTVRTNQPYGQICVRLCDVSPDGTSALLSLGVLNTLHRNGSEHPEAMAPHSDTDLTITLDQLACSVATGHRLRLAVSTSYWPYLWPSPGKVRLTLLRGALHLPVRPASADDVRFEPPEGATAWDVDILRKASSTREVVRHPVSGMVTTEITNDFGKNRDRHHGLVSGSRTHERWSIHPEDPLSARVSIHWQQSGGRDEWQWSTDATVNMHCDAEFFHIETQLIAREGDVEVFRRQAGTAIKREYC